jgi:hypothetical protein
VPTIPLFVSSTFSDFHAERDSIRDVVVPRLNAALTHLGSRVELIDLRAGVQGGGDSEAESDLRVLEVCAQEIERAHPSFVVLVGARGGWTPREDLARTLLGGRGLEAVAGLSVTEIEVLLAARSARTPSALTALFRSDHPDYPDAWRERQEAAAQLRRRIAADPSFSVAEYSAPPDAEGVLDLHAFEALLEERLRPGLISRAEALAAEDDPIRRATMLFRETRRPLQDAYDPVAREVTEHLDHGASVCLFGEPGVGTSTAWCATLDLAAERFDIRAVAVAGTDIAAGATDILRHVLQRPRPGDDIERHVDLASLFVLGSTSEPELYEMRARPDLVRDLAAAGIDAEPPLLVAIDAVDEVFTASDRTAILDTMNRSDQVRWLLTTGDRAVRNDLKAMGFEVVDVGPLAGEDLLYALQASTRSLAPGRELPAPVVEILASGPRAVAWVEAAMRVLLRPGREELESLPDGDGWLEAFDGRMVGTARELSPDIADLRAHTFRRAESFVGEERFTLLLAALESSFLGLERDTLAEVVGLPLRDVARVAAMLDPILRTTTDGRLIVGDAETVRSRLGDLPPAAVDETHGRTAQVLLRSGLHDTTSQLECLWHLVASGRDISPVLGPLARGTLPPDGPADIVALDRILSIFRRSIDADLHIAEVDDTTALLLARLASRAVKQSHARETLRRLRAGISGAASGLTRSHVLEALDARTAMAEFVEDRHTRYYAQLDGYLQGLVGRRSGTRLAEWELADILWSTATLIPESVRSENTPRLRSLLDVLESVEDQMLERSAGSTRHRVRFSFCLIRSYLAEPVRRVSADLGLQIRDRMTRDLWRLFKERPLDDSVRRLLIDVLLVPMGPPDSKGRGRIVDAVELLRRTKAERRAETVWAKLHGDALLLQSQFERRLSGRPTVESLKVASEAESVFRAFHSALPSSPVEKVNLARSIAERITADPSARGDEAAQPAVLRALSEAAELVVTARQTGGRDWESRYSYADATFTVARVMLEHDRERGIGLLELAREAYHEATRIHSSRDVSARIALACLLQAESELLAAKLVVGGPEDWAELTRGAGRSRASVTAGLQNLDRVGPPARVGGDVLRLRSELLNCLAEALILTFERTSAGTRKDLMEASRTLEKSATTLREVEGPGQRSELGAVVGRLLGRLLALEVDGRPFGSRDQRERWEVLRRDLEPGVDRGRMSR